MTCKLISEILVMWVCYILYMAILVHKRGPIGGLFFYPKAVQERVIALGYITEAELRKRRTSAYVLILAWMAAVPMVLILAVNGARSWWDCCWQFYVLFLGAEFYDWLFIDTFWVALSDWWLITGTEDLDHIWHTTEAKKWKFLELIPFSVPLAALMGTLYWGAGKIFL